MTDSFQPMPDLSAEQLDALRTDIAAQGVLVPVVKDQHGRIIDGNNRAAIAAELGIDYPVQLVEIGDDNEAAERAVVLNCSRRHLTRAQVRTVIANEMQRCPDDSDRAIARRVGCSPATVGAVRAKVFNLNTLEAELEKCAHQMRVDAACRMIPLLLDDNRDAADDDDEDSDNGSPATTVRAAWRVGMDWLESRGDEFPGRAATVWLRSQVWQELDTYLADGWEHDRATLWSEQEGPLSDEKLKTYSPKMKAWLGIPTAETYLDRLRHHLPLMAVVLRESWPDVFTDTADEWTLKTLAAEAVSA